MMEEVLRISPPLPSRVLHSFIDSESDETEQQDIFSSSPPDNCKQNISSLVTLPRSINSSSSLYSFQDTVPEGSEIPSKKILSRKAPIIRRTSAGEQFAKYRKNHVFEKSLSATLDGTMPAAYNPSEPLTKLPIKQQMSVHCSRLQTGDSYFTRTKSIKATIGPLTKEVCGKLNISWEDSDPCVSPQDKVHTITVM